MMQVTKPNKLWFPGSTSFLVGQYYLIIRQLQKVCRVVKGTRTADNLAALEGAEVSVFLVSALEINIKPRQC